MSLVYRRLREKVASGLPNPALLPHFAHLALRTYRSPTLSGDAAALRGSEARWEKAGGGERPSPGEYPDGLLRTLQRRVKEWRRAAPSI